MIALLWLPVIAILIGCMVLAADAPTDPLAHWDDPHDWSDR